MSSSLSLRIGTRKSPLALRQADLLQQELIHHHPSLKGKITIVPMVTQGDKILHQKLEDLGGKGLFTKELEEALLKKEIDMAIHSVKDMATLLPSGLILACLLKREDPRDGFISRDGTHFEDLPSGALIGTASLRRQSQLLSLRPDLVIQVLRGNVESRLEKIHRGIFAGTLLAVAGLKRLGLTEHLTQIFSLDQLLPAVGQGALGVECREDDSITLQLLEPLHHLETGWCVTAERAFLKIVDGSCRTPIGGHALLKEGQLFLRGLVADPQGKKVHRAEEKGDPTQAEALGQALGEKLREHLPPQG